MFSVKNKLDKNLRYLIDNKCYKSYRVLIEYKNLKSNLEKRLSSKGFLIYTFKSSNIICANLPSNYIEKLIEYPEVSNIVFDEYLFLCGLSVSTANKHYVSKNFSLSGKNIGIGLIDSGIYPHDNLLYPHNNIGSFTDIVNHLKYPYDDNGHGTCMAGIIGDNGVNSNSIYKGVATGSKLHCYKAFDKLGKGYASDILFSIESLSENAEVYNLKLLCLPFELLTHNIFIINVFNSAFDYCLEKGIIPIVPSGSNKNDFGSIMGIATLDNCITVGGIDTSLTTKLYDYSSCGPYQKRCKPNILCACANITSLNSDTSFYSEKNGMKLYPSKLNAEYKSFSGTSLSCAYVTGLCALLYEKHPNLTFDDIVSLLGLSCDKLEDLPKSKIGEGILNTRKLFTDI